MTCVKQHVATKMHTRNMCHKNRVEARLAHAKKLIEFFPTDAAGSTLSVQTHLHRMEVARAFLTDGVTFEPLRQPNGCLRSLLQHFRCTLPRNEVMSYIPTLHAEEIETLIEELKDAKDIAFEFDGTPAVAELLAVVVTYLCSKNLRHSRCVSLAFFANHLNANELAAALMDVLSDRYHIPLERWLFDCRDGAAVNGAAVDRLTVFARNLVDLVCWSHSLVIFGRQFELACSAAWQFLRWWSQLISRSPTVRRMVLARLGEAAMRLIEQRWYRGCEALKQVFLNLADVEAILRELGGDEGTENGALTARLLEIFDSPEALNLFRMEAIAIVENGRLFVSGCYLLEGDSFLAPKVHTVITGIQDHFAHLSALRLPRSARSPDLWMVICTLYEHNDDREKHFDETVEKMYPAFTTLTEQISPGGRLNNCYDKFRGARLFDHEWVAEQELIVLEGEIIFLTRLPTVPMERVRELKAELEAYQDLARAQGPADNHDLWLFWRRNRLHLPTWFGVARHVALMLTSSARCERVFSLYQGMFNDQQEGALRDYKEAAVMMRYNKVQREKYQNVD